MSSVSFVPETTTVVPAKVSIEMTPEQAGRLRALVGQCRSGELGDLFVTLARASTEHDLPRFKVEDAHRVPAIKFTPA